MTHTRSINWWPSALSLAERAALRRIAGAGPDTEPTSPGASRPSRANGASRANRWRSQRPFDRPEFLVRRLRIDGLTEPEFEALADAPAYAASTDLEPPSWRAEGERTE